MTPTIYPFQIGQLYRRRDIYKIVSVSEETRGGNWETGYARYGDDWFLFCNLGVPGNSGHDYPNEFIGDDLLWFGKTNSHLGQPSIKSILSDKGNVYVFTRTKLESPFVFAGIGTPIRVEDTTPVTVLWGFVRNAERRPEVLPEEVLAPSEIFEGAVKSIRVNIYERNTVARHLCIEKYGTQCSVCDVNLENVYGEIAQGFIHVHHLKPLSEIDAIYRVDPIRDLRPVCPNCHAILHRRKPPFSIEELRDIVHAAKKLG